MFTSRIPKIAAHLTGRAHTNADYSVRLTDQDTYQLPDHIELVRIVSGTAWISYMGLDHIVPEGQSIMLMPSRSASAVVSSIGHQPVELEIHFSES